MQKKVACSLENAKSFRQAIREWPELEAVVRGLQEQGMFPGMHKMVITFSETGLPEGDPLKPRLLELAGRK